MSNWSFADIPDQTGRIAIVTGASSGIGLETARMLAQKGAEVVLACRSLKKGEAALEKIRPEKPTAKLSVAELDLSDLDSVEHFAQEFRASHGRLDLLLNNAGVMVPPFGRTRQGFELQLGTNHLGHFALTGRLLPLLRATPGARVVVVSSTMQKIGRIDFTDLNYERRPYRGWFAYGQSKLANMLFARELGRRLAAAGIDVRVTAAHPGWAATDLQRTSPFMRFWGSMLAMTPAEGALPTLRAATDPQAQAGSFFGPKGPFELRGAPALARVPWRAQDDRVAQRLFDLSQELTGVRYDFGMLAPAQPSAT